MSEQLVLIGIVLAALSGVPGLCLSRRSSLGPIVAATLAVLGGGLCLAGVVQFWRTGVGEPIVRPWGILGVEFHVAMDGLSAFFLVPIWLISLLGQVYGLRYWDQAQHPDNGRKLRLFYGLVAAGMALLVIARNSIVFMFGWEIMALSAFFLVTTEEHDREVRETGWVYFVAAHVATLSLFALFGLLRAVSGSFEFAVLADDAVNPGISTAMFVLALIGFGIKAGIMPLHVWLPSSHAIAPSHVSAIMSGVIIKMGIYGLVRITSLFPHPPLAWGVIVLMLGAISGVLGVAFAIGQHDLKRLLAYHSIENIGIIVMGIGLALIGRSLDRAEWIILGLSGGLLHVWNHAFFKGLLFLSAGSVIHAVHTREIDQLGGLAKSMPRTAVCFVVGAVAICGLPPLNGFVSEFLIYLGLFSTLGIDGGRSFSGATFAVPALALIGTLAVACFVKVFGAVFLGTARTELAAHAHESPASMIFAMSVLVVTCAFIGIVPGAIVPMLSNAVSAWAPELSSVHDRLTKLAPLTSVSSMAVALIAVSCAIAIWFRSRLRNSVVDRGSTWGCGFAAPTARMQYTSSSFAQMVVELFGWALRPRTHRPRDLGLFPQRSEFHSHVPEVVLDEAVVPSLRFGAKLCSYFRVFQQGSIQAYLLYIFVTLVALLLWR